MRVRLTTGQHRVEIEADGYSRQQLDDTEAAALRMLTALRIGQPAEQRTVFGFAADRDRDLDGISLDATTERAEPYDDGRDAEYDDEDDAP